MSSLAVRNAFRGLAGQTGWPVPFHETSNQAPAATALDGVNLWSTFEFQVFTDEAVTVARPALRRERGEVTIVVAGRSGGGDVSVITAAESVRTYVRAWTPSDPQLRILAVEAPDDDAPRGTRGEWHDAAVTVEYEYDSYH